MHLPNLLVADENGNFMEVPELSVAGINFVKPVSPATQILTPCPAAVPLQALPGRVAIGYDLDLNRHVQLREIGGHDVFPVAALLPSNYLPALRPAYSTLLDAPRLPEAVYCAVGCHQGQHIITAILLPSHLQQHAVSEAQNGHVLDEPPGAITGADQFSIMETRPADSPVDLYWFAEAVTGSDFLNRPGRLTLHIVTARADRFDAFHSDADGRFIHLQHLLTHRSRAGLPAEVVYHVFPGLTDHPDELSAFRELQAQFPAITLRLTGMKTDPDWFIDEMHLFHMTRSHMGIAEWYAAIPQTPKTY